jgi:hypothetical protein
VTPIWLHLCHDLSYLIIQKSIYRKVFSLVDILPVSLVATYLIIMGLIHFLSHIQFNITVYIISIYTLKNFIYYT